MGLDAESRRSPRRCRAAVRRRRRARSSAPASPSAPGRRRSRRPPWWNAAGDGPGVSALVRALPEIRHDSPKSTAQNPRESGLDLARIASLVRRHDDCAAASARRATDSRSAAPCRASASAPGSIGSRGESGVTGRVRNDAAGVTIEAFGDLDALERFVDRLRADPPPAARIVESSSSADPRRARRRTSSSSPATASGEPRVSIPPDLATCPTVRRRDRRSGEPPLSLPVHQLHQLRSALHHRDRHSLRPRRDDDGAVRDVPGVPARVRRRRRSPLPRAAERLSGLRPAADARARFDRRARSASTIPIAAAAEALRGGLIVAVKGIGGFHLACDATCATRVARLRERKHRDEKPFAVMVARPGRGRGARRCSATRSGGC